MFTLIESRDEVAKAKRKLEAAIRRDFKKEGGSKHRLPWRDNVRCFGSH